MHIKLPQKIEDKVRFWRRKLLPRTLFFRTMMLIFVPLIVVQVVSVVVFFDGSWSRMGRKLSENLVDDISVLIQLKEQGMPKDELQRLARDNLQINFNFYDVKQSDKVKKKLSEIIDEINSAYNKNFDPDVASKSALQMRDLLLKNGHLRDSARNNSLRDFKFAYFDAVQDALLDGYEQNQDFFALLLDNEERKREIMQVFLEDVYKQLREG